MGARGRARSARPRAPGQHFETTARQTAEGEAVTEAGSQPVSHPIDLLLLYHFFGSRFIIVIQIHNIMFGVDAGIIDLL